MKKYEIGITFGAFEIFHIGHLNIFKNAKKYCKKLIVCVSDDDFILQKKKHKALIPLEYRLEIIRNIKLVDAVDIQSLITAEPDFKDTKKELIERHNAKVILMGDDWNNKSFTGKDLGVRVIYLPRTKNISSSMIYKNLKTFD